MQLPTIEMPVAEARERFQHYRRAVRDKHQAEDAAIAAGYKALANGTPLIRLSEVMVMGGVKKKGMRRAADVTVPCLAVCRADKPFAWTNGVHRDGSLVIAGKQTHSHFNKKDVLHWGGGTFESLPDTDQLGWNWGTGNYRLNALTPNIPPPLRPRTALSNFHILWEAEWKVAPGPPPGDPALLKHIGGDLYAVHAVWDLTELEQAVLAGRPLPE
jgi:hypothetical protein